MNVQPLSEGALIERGWSRFARHPERTLFLIALIVTLAFYARALLLPLYMDDVILGRYASGITLPELFYNIHLLPYYRPLSLAPWKLVELLTGSYSPLILHAFNLIVHLVNGWLIGILAWRYTRLLRVAVLAALIYLAFPFSYQAVTWAAALGHLLALLGLLGALLCFERWQRARSTALALGMWASILVAVLSHENGAAVIGVLFLRLLISAPNTPSRGKLSDLVNLFAPALLIILLYGAIWLQLPKNSTGAQFNFGDMAQNALYFSQGLSFPIAWVFRFTTLDEHTSALLALILMLLGFGLAFRVAHERRSEIAFGLLWFAAAALVPTLFLSNAYVIAGPRLMMFASGGAALAWAVALDSLMRQRRAKPSRLLRLRQAGAWIAAAALLIVSGVFVVERLDLFERLASVYQTLWDVTRTSGDAVYVNLPAWVAYKARTFPIGSEGITYMGDYIGFPDLIWMNTGQWGNSTALVRDDLQPEFEDYWFWTVSPHAAPDAIAQAIRQRGRGYLFTNVAEQWVWASVERSPATPAGASFAFANGVQLWIEPPVQNASAPIPLGLTWQFGNQAALSDDLSVFVHLDCGGTLISQADGAPLRGAFPFPAWQPGETWREVRYLAPTGQADCDVQVGLYSLSSGERVALTSGGDAAVVPLQ